MKTTQEIYNHQTANAHISKHDIIVGNFLGGLAWGFGTVVGATIVVAIVFGILKQFNFIPGIKSLTSSETHQTYIYPNSTP